MHCWNNLIFQHRLFSHNQLALLHTLSPSASVSAKQSKHAKSKSKHVKHVFLAQHRLTPQNLERSSPGLMGVHLDFWTKSSRCLRTCRHLPANRSTPILCASNFHEGMSIQDGRSEDTGDGNIFETHPESNERNRRASNKNSWQFWKPKRFLVKWAHACGVEVQIWRCLLIHIYIHIYNGEVLFNSDIACPSKAKGLWPIQELSSQCPGLFKNGYMAQHLFSRKVISSSLPYHHRFTPEKGGPQLVFEGVSLPLSFWGGFQNLDWFAYCRVWIGRSPDTQAE